MWKTDGVIALALLILVLPACTGTDSTHSNVGTTLSEVANASKTNLIGKTVTVSGEVEEVISPKAFIIEGDRLFNDPKVFVVNTTQDPAVEDALVQVTGTVRQFSKAEIEHQFDLDLAQELEVKFRGKPVLIAKVVVLTPHPGEIAEEPNPYIGKAVTISGKVAKVIGTNAFTLDDQELIGGKELLVVGVMPAVGSINVGQTVRVTGLIRKFVATQMERNFDLDLQPRLKAEYEGKPVAIARAIQIVR